MELDFLIIKKEYNIILLIVNRFIHYIYIILFKKKIYNSRIKNYYIQQAYIVL